MRLRRLPAGFRIESAEGARDWGCLLAEILLIDDAIVIDDESNDAWGAVLRWSTARSGEAKIA
jgi:hypothetical protein